MLVLAIGLKISSISAGIAHELILVLSGFLHLCYAIFSHLTMLETLLRYQIQITSQLCPEQVNSLYSEEGKSNGKVSYKVCFSSLCS